MSDRQVPHLRDDELLTLLDGELPERDASDFRSHVAACWTCRTRMEEMKNTIGEYVRYRDAVRTVSPPPASWTDLRPRFERIDRSLAPSVSSRPETRPRRFALRPAYWLAAAAILILIVFIRRLENVPPVSAAELLRKATVAEQKPTARRRIRITTRHRQFTRPSSLAAAAAAQTDDLEQVFARARFSWDEPFSARSFAAWRDQLPSKQDEAPSLDDSLYRIRTSTTASELRRATLVLRAQDLQPMSETLEFTTDTVEITAAADAEPSPETSAAPARAPERAPARNPPRPVEIASPAHRELQVFSALHNIGADLGEPVEMSVDAGRLVITGAGLTAERKLQLQASLEPIPGVDIRFEDASPSARPRSAPADRATASAAPLRQRLQTLLGSRESVDDFTNGALDASDAMMARAHALRSLAKAFSPDVESSLSPNDREVLTTLRRDHAAALSKRLRELRTVLNPILNSSSTQPSRVTPSEAWQDAVQTVFTAAQNLDQLLNRALAGSTMDVQDPDFQRITAALLGVEQAVGTLP